MRCLGGLVCLQRGPETKSFCRELLRHREDVVLSPGGTTEMSYLLEEGAGCAIAVGPVADLGLRSQVLGGFDGGLHPFHSEESSQVSRVGGDHDECEEPPHSGHHPGRHGPEGRQEEWKKG